MFENNSRDSHNGGFQENGSSRGYNGDASQNNCTYHYDSSRMPYKESFQQSRPERNNWSEQTAYSNQPQPLYPTAGTARKKSGKALKWIAGGLAVVVLSFSFSYLGTTLANKNHASGRTAGGSMPAPVITTSSTQETGPETMIQAVANATVNSVVEITTESVTTGDYFRQQIVSGAGSGVIISSDGYIVTNHHVIEGSTKITVTLRDGTQYPGALVGTDKKTDIAVIKTDASNLQPVVFGDSDALKIGEPAIVIGNPLGQLGGTVTSGIISALDRQIAIDGQVMTLLQTNAAINPGNSGGALFNQKGELVGVVNAKSGGTNVEGLGFAIPANIAKPIINDLIAFGYVQGRVDLGISLIDIDDAITAMMNRLDSLGVYISYVESGSNAEKLGLRVGDRLVRIDGQEVAQSADVSKIIDPHSVGDEIEIEISRDGQMGRAVLTLQEYKGGGLSL